MDPTQYPLINAVVSNDGEPNSNHKIKIDAEGNVSISPVVKVAQGPQGLHVRSSGMNLQGSVFSSNGGFSLGSKVTIINGKFVENNDDAAFGGQSQVVINRRAAPKINAGPAQAVFGFPGDPAKKVANSVPAPNQQPIVDAGEVVILKKGNEEVKFGNQMIEEEIALIKNDLVFNGSILQAPARGNNIVAEDCPSLNKLFAEEKATLTNCPSVAFANAKKINAKNCGINKLLSKEECQIDKSTVGNIIFAGNMMELTDSTITSIVVREKEDQKKVIIGNRLNGVVGGGSNINIKGLKINGKSIEDIQKPQTIVLINTTVEDDITFEGNEGKVILLGTSKVKGEVYNGQMRREKNIDLDESKN